MIQVLSQQNVHRQVNSAKGLMFRPIADKRYSRRVRQQMERHLHDVSRL